MSEIADFALIVLLVSGCLTAAIVATKLSERVGIPAAVVVLVASAVASDLSPDLRNALSVDAVERIAVVALIIILLSGGMDIGWGRLRAAAGPVLSIGVLGTFLTAGALAVAARLLLGVDWVLAGIIGAALAPTDPAVVFSVLGRREIAGRSGVTLEGEAGVNDPAGIALMLGMIELATHPDATPLVVLEDFAVEMAVGVAFGLVAARGLVPLLRRLRLASEGLHPVLVLTVAGVVYGCASVAGGSGFLAVFILGLFLGDAVIPYKAQLERFRTSLASLAEIAVFIALGLTVDLGSLSTRTWVDGVLLALFLAAVARPLTVLLTLWRAGMSRRERAFIAWSGLKGAVPILLAAFAVLAGVDGAQRVYGLVFVVVVCSVLGQGTLVTAVARRLAIPMRDRPTTPWQLSVGLSEEPAGARQVTIEDGSVHQPQRVGDLELAEGEWISLILRDGRALQPRAGLGLRAGDVVHVLSHADERRAIPAERSRLRGS